MTSHRLYGVQEKLASDCDKGPRINCPCIPMKGLEPGSSVCHQDVLGINSIRDSISETYSKAVSQTRAHTHTSTCTGAQTHTTKTLG